MPTILKQKIEAPEGHEFASFDQETMTIEFQPIREALGDKKYEIERAHEGGRYYFISSEGIIEEDVEEYTETDENRRSYGNYGRDVSELTLALKKFRLDRKLRIAEARENPEGWVNLPNTSIYSLRLTIGSGWDVVGEDETWHWFTFGQFATRTGAERFLFSLTDDEKETLLTYWRIK